MPLHKNKLFKFYAPSKVICVYMWSFCQIFRYKYITTGRWSFILITQLWMGTCSLLLKNNDISPQTIFTLDLATGQVHQHLPLMTLTMKAGSQGMDLLAVHRQGVITSFNHLISYHKPTEHSEHSGTCIYLYHIALLHQTARLLTERKIGTSVHMIISYYY